MSIIYGILQAGEGPTNWGKLKGASLVPKPPPFYSFAFTIVKVEKR